MDASARALADWLQALPAAELSALARRYTDATAAGGATMLRPSGEDVPIPPLLTPEVLPDDALGAVEASAFAILSGLSRLSRWLMTDEARGRVLRDRMFRAFGPYEREALGAAWREAERLATARVDFLVDDQGRPRALEVNSTIPAMQGYSDIVAAAFVRLIGGARGLDAAACDALLDDNGRNSDQLLASLLAHHRLLTGDASTVDASTGHALRIAIVARAGDSQTGELRHLVRRFGERGHPTVLVTPDALRLAPFNNSGNSGSGDGERLHVVDDVTGAPSWVPDLVYRHIFARRLDPASDFARALLDPRRHRILNPVASHLEAKAMLGLLSAAASTKNTADGSHDADLAAAIDLDEATRAEVRRVVPWTRVLGPGATRGPDGERLADLVSAVAADGERYVIKKSWDYGGRSVFLGFAHDERAALRAVDVLGAARFDNTPPTWSQLVLAAASDESDAWVVQERVRAGKRRHLVPGTSPDSTPTWKDLYVDLSVFTNLGVAARPHGGVCRAAPGLIVNLQGGGGMAPLLREAVLARLMK